MRGCCPGYLLVGYVAEYIICRWWQGWQEYVQYLGVSEGESPRPGPISKCDIPNRVGCCTKRASLSSKVLFCK